MLTKKNLDTANKTNKINNKGEINMSYIAMYLYIVIASLVFYSFSIAHSMVKFKSKMDTNRRLDLLTDNSSIFNLINNRISTEEFCEINNIVLHTNAKVHYIQINNKGKYEMFTKIDKISSISLAQLILMQDLNSDYADRKLFDKYFFFGTRAMQLFLNEYINETKRGDGLMYLPPKEKVMKYFKF